MDIVTLTNRFRPRTKRDWIIVGAAALVCVGLFKLLFGGNEDVSAPAVTTPTVTLAPAGTLAADAAFTAVGAVEAVAEAQLKAEAGGQVVAVMTELGQAVAAGTVIAQLENSRERAALTQAEGAYEAAVAGAAQGDSGARDAALRVDTSKNALDTTLRNAYTTINSTLTSTVDQFFANPRSYYPGLRVRGDAELLNTERVTLQTTLPSLQTKLATLSDGNRAALADETITEINRVLMMTASLLRTVERDGSKDELAGQPLSAYAASLYSTQSALTSLIATIENAERDVATAEEAAARATVGGTDTTVSTANAQLKIALGSLRAAQASYEQTLVRTPIAGVVNALTIKRGDYVAPLQDVAVVANNNGLQVVTAVNDADRERIAVGDIVRLNTTATGTITAIAGAVDSRTGKVAVKVSVDALSGLRNGMTVEVAFTKAADTAVTTAPLTIPLSAVKLAVDGAAVFVVNNGTLETLPVTLGPVTGDQVVVTTGLTPDTVIVLDVRGRKAGESVTVVTQ